MESQLSRSEKKRRAKAVEQLVQELASLPPGEIAQLPCDQELRDEISAVRGLKSGARKRQLKYATKLLRDAPVGDLYDFMARKKGSLLKERKEFHELEHFRNILLDEAVQAYEETIDEQGYMVEEEPFDILAESEIVKTIMAHFPKIDSLALKNSAMQFAKTRNRKFSRELFRILKAAKEKEQFS